MLKMLLHVNVISGITTMDISYMSQYDDPLGCLEGIVVFENTPTGVFGMLVGQLINKLFKMYLFHFVLTLHRTNVSYQCNTCGKNLFRKEHLRRYVRNVYDSDTNNVHRNIFNRIQTTPFGNGSTVLQHQNNHEPIYRTYYLVLWTMATHVF